MAGMVTVGMYYEVVPGREHDFEEKFDSVLGVMRDQEGHTKSLLFRQVGKDNSYAILSEWDSRGAFASFIGSDVFRKVTDWGKSGILAGRPRHDVYSQTSGLD